LIKTAAVTGAAAGIGRAIAEALATAGYRCFLIDRDAARAADLAAGLPGAGHRVFAADLLSATARQALIAEVSAAAPEGLSVLVNNAGMTDGSGAGFAETTAERLAMLEELNLTAPLELAAGLISHMQKGGVVINIASGAGINALPLRGGYSATKAGVISATQAQQAAFAPLGVAPVAVAPGYVRTELVEALIEKGHIVPERAVSRVPLGRMGEAAEIAAACVALAGGLAPALAGQVLSVDGGSSVLGGTAPLAPPEALPRAGEAWLLSTADDLTLPGFERRSVEDLGRDETALSAVLLDLRGGRTMADLQHAASVALPRLAGGSGALCVLLDRPEPSDIAAAARVGACEMAVRLMACEWGRKSVRVTSLRSDRNGGRSQAALAAFLLSEKASYITGNTLTPQI